MILSADEQKQLRRIFAEAFRTSNYTELDRFELEMRHRWQLRCRYAQPTTAWLLRSFEDSEGLDREIIREELSDRLSEPVE